jgi:hypothetical protein
MEHNSHFLQIEDGYVNLNKVVGIKVGSKCFSYGCLTHYTLRMGNDSNGYIEGYSKQKFKTAEDAEKAGHEYLAKNLPLVNGNIQKDIIYN